MRGKILKPLNEVERAALLGAEQERLNCHRNAEKRLRRKRLTLGGAKTRVEKISTTC